jgi:hypothetical protein
MVPRRSYRKYRVRSNFDTVIRNIETINSYKSLYQSEFPHLIWQFVVFGHNEKEIPVAREMGAKLGMEFFTKLTCCGFFAHSRQRVCPRTDAGTINKPGRV